MKQVRFIKLFLSALILLSCSTVWSQNTDAMIKITADPISRDYKLLFAATKVFPVSVSLKSVDGSTTLFEEDFGDVQNFVKKYSLLEAPLGRYQWEIKYGNKTYAEDFEIVSEKKAD